MNWSFLRESNSYNTTSVVWLFTELYSLLTLCFWKAWIFDCVDLNELHSLSSNVPSEKWTYSNSWENQTSIASENINTHTSLFIFPKHSPKMPPKTLFSQNKQLLCWWWQFWHLVNILTDMTDLSVAAIMFSLWDVVWYMKYNECKTQELGAAWNNL